MRAILLPKSMFPVFWNRKTPEHSECRGRWWAARPPQDWNHRQTPGSNHICQIHLQKNPLTAQILWQKQLLFLRIGSVRGFFISLHKKFPSTGFEFYFLFKSPACFGVENFPGSWAPFSHTLSHGFTLTTRWAASSRSDSRETWKPLRSKGGDQ